MDKLTKEQRHRCMSAIKGKNTKPELLVRKFLFSRGFRYRLNHEGCKYYVLPKTNVDFWQNKIERNRSRDIEERQQLTSMGWHCITIWECQLKPKVRQQTLEALEYTLYHIYLEDRRIKSYETTEEEYSMVAEPVENYGKSE